MKSIIKKAIANLQKGIFNIKVDEHDLESDDLVPFVEKLNLFWNRMEQAPNFYQNESQMEQIFSEARIVQLQRLVELANESTK